MAEAFYRLKSAGGAFTRVTGTAPITVSGLTEGAVYEYVKGDGTLGEVTSGVSFSPANIFETGDKGGYFRPGPDNCWTDTARTTLATVGDAVASFKFSNPNGDSYFEQSVLAARMILRQTAGGLYYLERDTTDDRVDLALQLSAARCTGGMAYVPDGSDFLVFINGSETNPWVGIGVDGGGSGSGITSAGVTQNAVYFDNTENTSGTRAGQYTAAQSAKRVVFDFNMASSWPTFSVGKYGGSGAITSPGDIYGLYLINKELTAQQRGDMDGWLAAGVPA